MQTETPASPPPPAEAPASAPQEDTNDFTGLVLLIGAIVALGFLAGWGWAFFVVAVIFMIFMHELGHYLTARWTGMKVTEFFIGFGPRLWSFRKGETEYGVKGIPAGAYVRIIGMNNLDPVEPGDEPRSYRVKSWPRKMLVVSAGSMMHFMMAIVLFGILAVGYGLPREDGSWAVSQVSAASAADDVGIEPGDRIISIDGVEAVGFEAFSDIVQARGGQSVEVVWERDGETLTGTTDLRFRLTDAGADAFVGLYEGDRILAVEGAEVKSWDDLLVELDARGAGAVRVLIDPVEPGELLRFDVDYDPQQLPPVEEAATGFFGVGQEPATYTPGPVDASWHAVTSFGEWVVLSGEGLVQFFTPGSIGNFLTDTFRNTTGIDTGGDVTTTDVARENPVIEARSPDEDRILSIYGAVRIGANSSFEQSLGLLALLNVFIGIFNLVPLPPLDGGHVAIGTYERIRSIGGRRYEVDYARVLPLTYAVFGFLVVIGMFALVRDIIDPINLG
ncbi:MAG: site-2 protease family protein [Actinomycetota bacterium]